MREEVRKLIKLIEDGKLDDGIEDIYHTSRYRRRKVAEEKIAKAGIGVSGKKIMRLKKTVNPSYMRGIRVIVEGEAPSRGQLKYFVKFADPIANAYAVQRYGERFKCPASILEEV